MTGLAISSNLGLCLLPESGPLRSIASVESDGELCPTETRGWLQAMTAMGQEEPFEFLAAGRLIEAQHISRAAFRPRRDMPSTRTAYRGA